MWSVFCCSAGRAWLFYPQTDKSELFQIGGISIFKSFYRNPVVWMRSVFCWSAAGSCTCEPAFSLKATPPTWPFWDHPVWLSLNRSFCWYLLNITRFLATARKTRIHRWRIGKGSEASLLHKWERFLPTFVMTIFAKYFLISFSGPGSIFVVQIFP